MLEGNIANEDNMVKSPMRKGVICMTTDGIYSTSERLGCVCVCDNTFHLKASQQSTSLPKAKMPAVKVADGITPT